MNIRDVLKIAFECVYWFAVAAAIGVPFVLSLYVLTTPRHRLLEAWQNYRMRSSKKVLKDRHFKNMPRILGLCKVLSVFILIASSWVICWELGVVDYWPPAEWWKALTEYM